MNLSHFNLGDRVALHPGLDYWMRGIRYATVEKIGRRYLYCRSDAGKALRVPADCISEVVETRLTPYAQRVRELEREGCTTSDAQSIADVEGLED